MASAMNVDASDGIQSVLWPVGKEAHFPFRTARTGSARQISGLGRYTISDLSDVTIRQPSRDLA
jgi:hypothetical protein